ncbi:hypothetical protein RIF29_37927 [Crotalaria pallida]|uniref:Uncharacterized protein n=1 Tax=Crotalaria pallida TaxID=3830 RepID=A0AAN9DZ16_CROPI
MMEERIEDWISLGKGIESSTASLLIRIGTYGASIGVRRAGNRPVTSIPSARYGWSVAYHPTATRNCSLLVLGFSRYGWKGATCVATVPWVGDWKRNHRVAAWG